MTKAYKDIMDEIMGEMIPLEQAHHVTIKKIRTAAEKRGEILTRDQAYRLAKRLTEKGILISAGSVRDADNGRQVLAWVKKA